MDKLIAGSVRVIPYNGVTVLANLTTGSWVRVTDDLVNRVTRMNTEDLDDEEFLETVVYLSESGFLHLPGFTVASSVPTFNLQIEWDEEGRYEILATVMAVAERLRDNGFTLNITAVCNDKCPETLIDFGFTWCNKVSISVPYDNEAISSVKPYLSILDSVVIRYVRGATQISGTLLRSLVTGRNSITVQYPYVDGNVDEFLGLLDLCNSSGLYLAYSPEMSVIGQLEGSATAFYLRLLKFFIGDRECESIIRRVSNLFKWPTPKAAGSCNYGISFAYVDKEGNLRGCAAPGSVVLQNTTLPYTPNLLKRKSECINCECRYFCLRDCSHRPPYYVPCEEMRPILRHKLFIWDEDAPLEVNVVSLEGEMSQSFLTSLKIR